MAETFQEPIKPRQTYAELLREVASSSKDLVQSEITLITAEFKETIQRAQTHLAQSMIFCCILALSVLPFIAFLVIGLGELLDGRYWLSSLIVAVAGAIIGGVFAYRSYRKLKHLDMDFSHSREGLKRSAQSAIEKFDEVEDAVKGETHA